MADLLDYWLAVVGWKTGCGRFHQYYVAGETADCSNWEKNYSDCELWVDRWGLDAAMDSP